MAALRTVLFLTTERSYIFVHPHSCLERLYILQRRCVQHNSHDEAIFISTGTVQNTAPESEFLILSMTSILLLVIICAPRRIFTLQLFTKWFESHCIPALMMYLLFMFTFFPWTYCLLEPLSGHIFSRKIVFLFIFKFQKTFVGKRRRRHLMLNWPWWHVNDWTCGSRVVFSVASVHNCRKRTQVQMQAKENESVFILCVVSCICICVGVVHV